MSYENQSEFQGDYLDGSAESPAPESGAEASSANPNDAAEATAGTSSEGTSSREAPPSGYVEREALDEARRTIQELRDEMKYFRGKLDATQPAAEEEPEIDENAFWENPNGTLTEIRQKTRAEVKQELNESIQNLRGEISQMLARNKWEDYDQVETEFVREAEKDPSLWSALRANPSFTKDPAATVYKFMQQRNQDPNALRKEIEAEVLKKYGIQPQGGKKASPAVPPQSLAGQPSAGTAQPRELPESIDELMAMALNHGY